jgi:hypothetical protein
VKVISHTVRKERIHHGVHIPRFHQLTRLTKSIALTRSAGSTSSPVPTLANACINTSDIL